MRIIAIFICVATTTLLLSCDRKQAASGVDPELGRDCFEKLRNSLPPGSQYEGIDELEENRITIRIMNGVDIKTMDCGLSPDGTLR